ncbi:MAG: hypothetical protein SGJ19_19580 [Planctomycetia bacterium]|nr:hypothetical protein [Planctomycetia bacterium]
MALPAHLRADHRHDGRSASGRENARRPAGGGAAGGASIADIDALTKTTAPPADEPIVAALVEQVLNSGFKIPATAKGQLGQYDKNGDGRMDRAEFDATPATVQTLIRETAKSHIREELGRLKK